MKTREVTIHNWRSIRTVTLSAHDLMIFIGQNNHGKSNILSAILFFFGEMGLDGGKDHLIELLERFMGSGRNDQTWDTLMEDVHPSGKKDPIPLEKLIESERKAATQPAKYFKGRP